MRRKEGAADYRYFPEPDLPEVVLQEAYLQDLREGLPELPHALRRRYLALGLSMQDTILLANDKEVGGVDFPGVLTGIFRGFFRIILDFWGFWGFGSK